MPRLRWVIITAVALLAIFIAGTVYFFEFRRIGDLKADVAKKLVRLDEKERSVNEYREKVEFYKTKEGIAHLAREEYNLAFPGERIYIIVPESSDPVPPLP
ncbi:MAG: septum formation initiator family protein [Synergistaceae bacterium]|nr:septum formation initiator family protein [Synergistaceae bacterium]